MSEVLQSRILDAFPRSFITRLLERQLALYQQAVDHVMRDQPWSEVEAVVLLPYIRRALWETELRRAAIDCQLTPVDVPHVGQNATCVTVRAKRLVLTEHFVSGPSEFVRDAESRKQNAGVNRWLTHHVDPRLLIAPPPKLDEKPIYVNLLHGGVFPTSKRSDLEIDPSACFLRLAIPAADSKEYLAGCNWSAQELLQNYAGDEEPAVTIADRALPVVKKKSAS